MLAPLIVGGRSIGLFTVARIDGPAYDVEDIELLAEIGRRAGAAVESSAAAGAGARGQQTAGAAARGDRTDVGCGDVPGGRGGGSPTVTLLGCSVVGVWSAAREGRCG